jgi:hypothetical protein
LINVREDFLITHPQLEDRRVVRRQHLFSVGIGGGPFIKVEVMEQHSGVKQDLHVHSFINEVNQVVLEQVSVHIGVLVGADVVYHQVY